MARQDVTAPDCPAPPSRQSGFTLVELMITVVILAILVSIAIPAYNSQIQKSRRTDARNALMDLASREERYYSTANTYSSDPADLGYGAAGPWPAAPGMSVGRGYYTVVVQAVAAAPAAVPPTLAGYTITAFTAGTQVNDTHCAQFTVNQSGQQTALDGGGVAQPDCWQ